MWLLHFVFKYLHGMEIALDYPKSEFSWRCSLSLLTVVPSRTEGTLAICLALQDIQRPFQSTIGRIQSG